MDRQDVGIEHSINTNDLNSLFFSDVNVQALQQGIRYTVYTKTQRTIDKQSERELRVIMRSIYLQYGRNMPSNIVSQVKELNKRVLDYVVPKIIVELNQYRTYLQDASALPIPMDRGQNTSTTGTKFLHMKEF